MLKSLIKKLWKFQKKIYVLMKIMLRKMHMMTEWKIDNASHGKVCAFDKMKNFLITKKREGNSVMNWKFLPRWMCFCGLRHKPFFPAPKPIKYINWHALCGWMFGGSKSFTRGESHNLNFYDSRTNSESKLFKKIKGFLCMLR